MNRNTDMSDRLDDLVARLAASPTDRRLEAFDSEVSVGIRRSEAERRTAGALAPIGLASVVVALAMGVTVGGVIAAIGAPAADRTLLSVASLAPSSLLESQP
jgi:hypothetical protein